MNKLLGDFKHIIRATIEELDDVEGIGEVRAKNIKQGIKRMHEQKGLRYSKKREQKAYGIH